MADIASDIQRLHDCVHSVGERVDRAERQTSSALQVIAGKVEGVERNLSDTRETVAHMRGIQEMITARLGVREDAEKPPKPAFLMGPGGGKVTFWTIIGSLSGLLIAYQLLAQMLPGVLAVIHRTLMGAMP